MLLMTVASYGQTAKQVLDKAATAVSNKSGVTASFTLKGGQMNDKGTISIKGKKFQEERRGECVHSQRVAAAGAESL